MHEQSVEPLSELCQQRFSLPRTTAGVSTDAQRVTKVGDAAVFHVSESFVPHIRPVRKEKATRDAFQKRNHISQGLVERRQLFIHSHRMGARRTLTKALINGQSLSKQQLSAAVLFVYDSVGAPVILLKVLMTVLCSPL